jgi:HSP20 family molecular chaperone IbpA
LPGDIDAEKIRANLNEGVLTVTLPKKQRRPQVRRVEVKKG